MQVNSLFGENMSEEYKTILPNASIFTFMQIGKFSLGMIFINFIIHVMFINVRFKLLLIFQTPFTLTLAASLLGTAQWRIMLGVVKMTSETRRPSSRSRRRLTGAWTTLTTLTASPQLTWGENIKESINFGDRFLTWRLSIFHLLDFNKRLRDKWYQLNILQGNEEKWSRSRLWKY